MKYYFNTTTNRLKDEGFGILTEIDVTQTLKKKLIAKTLS